MLAYAFTIFVGAFLLFQVQPLMGKYILPWFGGGPGVWTTCLLFFQTMLLAGYAYAHAISCWLKPRGQAIIQVALIIAALALLPIIPADRWKPQGLQSPTLQILGLLAVTLGLPYFILSSTGPLLQQWFSRTRPGVSPYRLYALSNAGSLLALASYPFFFETHFTRRAQALMWGWGLLVYGIACAICALNQARRERVVGSSSGAAGEASVEGLASLGRGEGESSVQTNASSRAVSGNYIRKLLWFFLPACASVLLLATTNKICQDVAVIPFLWVLPLALYLLSFIICFDSPRWYVRFPFMLALIAALAADCWALFEGTDASIYKQVGIYSSALFVFCMVCHGELYRLRPDPSELTGFYLLIAAGGAAGGAFVALAAPMVFKDYYELHWGLLLCAVCFAMAILTERKPAAEVTGERTTLRKWDFWPWAGCSLPVVAFGGLDWLLRKTGHSLKFGHGLLWLRVGLWAILAGVAVVWLLRGTWRSFTQWRAVVGTAMFLGIAALGASLWKQAHDGGGDKIYTSRSFYGVLSIYEHEKQAPKDHYLLLQHGRITHGLQFVDPEESIWPTSYYGEESGIGVAFRALPPEPRRIGVVGLGTGSIRVYGRAGDYFRIYDINPEVKRLATTRFTYLNRCPGTTDVVLGDARISLETEPLQHFDLLALDAFSSDAIPVHLLTKEAFDVYDRHLKTNGIVAVHISNHYLDLEPVVLGLAAKFGFKSIIIDFEENDEEWWLYGSTWILLTRDDRILNMPAMQSRGTPPSKRKRDLPLWTDDFAGLFQILK
ncbi:MAG TPA: fused MFS/spermidine synthase [Candidatus Dormibacteraeota bacterium]|nr:fused MFS/spermidine synthase [Candidatus Dormibacteraeota bacterium]